MNKFGGNVYQQDINNIFISNSKKYKMNYSHKIENRWNLWEKDSGLVLSFTLNNGVFTPALVGIKRETLERFYSSNGSNVDGWVRHYIDYYYKELKVLLQHPEEQRAPKEVEQVKKLVKRRKKSKNEPIPGQLSLFDLIGE